MHQPMAYYSSTIFDQTRTQHQPHFDPYHSQHQMHFNTNYIQHQSGFHQNYSQHQMGFDPNHMHYQTGFNPTHILHHSGFNTNHMPVLSDNPIRNQYDIIENQMEQNQPTANANRSITNVEQANIKTTNQDTKAHIKTITNQTTKHTLTQSPTRQLMST